MNKLGDRSPIKGFKAQHFATVYKFISGSSWDVDSVAQSAFKIIAEQTPG